MLEQQAIYSPGLAVMILNGVLKGITGKIVERFPCSKGGNAYSVEIGANHTVMYFQWELQVAS